MLGIPLPVGGRGMSYELPVSQVSQALPGQVPGGGWVRARAVTALLCPGKRSVSQLMERIHPTAGEQGPEQPDHILTQSPLYRGRGSVRPQALGSPLEGT